MSEPAVSVHCIRHIYPDKTEVSLCGVELDIAAGTCTAILAANGEGKTTMLQHITGTLKPLEGRVRVFGLDPYRDFDQLRHRMGVVVQNAAEQIIAPTVAEDVGFGLHKLSEQERQERVEETLALLGISHLAGKVPHYLSGGEVKKVALAGVLASRPELLVLDEPFAGLDSRAVEELAGLLAKVNRELGTTIVFTSQQMEPVALLAQGVVLLHQGHVVARGTPLEVLSNVKVLENSGLRPPDLIKLSQVLAEKGLPVDPALDSRVLAEKIVRQKVSAGKNTKK